MLASETTKHYGIGYVSGSFDMFHIGHLNIIRRAKERCDFLVAGVLTDELIASGKKRWPVIPLKERMAIVEALRYVDRVDVTTPELISKPAAWEKYRFDAMFSGDDWLGQPGWFADERELNKLGADLVYFPYTKEVSTSKLQEMTLPPPKTDAGRAQKLQPFTHLFPFDKVKKGEKIVIYGTGRVAEQYYSQIDSLNFCETVAFTDTYCKEPGGFFDKPLLPPERLSDPGWYSRIIVASTVYFDGIVGKLRVMGIPADKIV
ncbi:MAG: adenylyltransferase/cytidyltransferase family protein [Clostridiales Family XIII bacterium]|jgi:glycerol-3-phosphate cytidylyltransferase|nr:adenylyltransferase/cytidyltransferase family protein [Clostridiales Family XIII bacterium]